MARSRRFVPPFETEILSLGPRGVGLGRCPDGRDVQVRGAPPGSRLAVQVFKRKKGTLHARRVGMIRPPKDYSTPRCPQFGLCGGCVLQELSLDAQRDAKHAMVTRDVFGEVAPYGEIHPPRGDAAAYGYRNKVELSFGVRRYLSEQAHGEGQAIDGRFLGFHAPGRFDRVVDTPHCALVHEDLNRILTTVRQHTLRPDAPPPYDVRSHEGFWRHLAMRQGDKTGEILITIFTTTPTPDQATAVERLADAILATSLHSQRVVGCLWMVNDGVADVARGEVRGQWGQGHLHEMLGDLTFQLSSRAFFQTNTRGAEVLYDTIGEALGTGGTLLDLYCGTGAIGLYLSERFDQVVGIEVIEDAVIDARENAKRNGIEASFHVGKVEDALRVLDDVSGQRHIVVDPPRAGLHPKVAKTLARADADTLVYVACKPSSLGRDREVLESGGWRLTDLWTVDMFPQTGHVEAVARFIRDVPTGEKA